MQEAKNMAEEISKIGQRIYDLRVERDIQQGELASAINIHQSVLNRIEKGTRPARDLEIVALANFFKVSADYLLDTKFSHTSSYQNSKNMHNIGDNSKIGQYIHITGSDNTISQSSAPAENDFSHKENEIIQKYRALDERGKKSVIDTLNREYSYV